MAVITQTAEQFFKARNRRRLAMVAANFARWTRRLYQAKLLAKIATLREYTEWMKGLLNLYAGDGRYEVKSFATDEQPAETCAWLWRSLRHPYRDMPGPLPPTCKSTITDYV